MIMLQLHPKFSVIVLPTILLLPILHSSKGYLTPLHTSPSPRQTFSGCDSPYFSVTLPNLTVLCCSYLSLRKVFNFFWNVELASVLSPSLLLLAPSLITGYSGQNCTYGFTLNHFKMVWNMDESSHTGNGEAHGCWLKASRIIHPKSFYMLKSLCNLWSLSHERPKGTEWPVLWGTIYSILWSFIVGCSFNIIFYFSSFWLIYSMLLQNEFQMCPRPHCLELLLWKLDFYLEVQRPR